jgi:hypothetical protein
VTAFRKAKELILHKEPVRLRYDQLIAALLGWFGKLYRPPGASDFLLDAAETALALVPQIVIDQTPPAADENPDDDDDDAKDALEWRTDDVVEM